jgi:arylsulfatase A-like enzyme
VQRWLTTFLPVLLVLSACSGTEVLYPSKDTAPPPNILLIVLDDFGYNDLGANGNPNTPTPNLDALAAEGIRYTRHYADATCSVARAALMTGTFPAVHGFRPNHLGLSPGTPTIASMLRDKGYRTQHIGKWHIVNATLEQSPSHVGFDDWYGFLFQNELGGLSADGIHYRVPTYRNPWLRDNQSAPEQQTGHLTNILTERAMGFLGQQKGQTRPWFLNLWYFAPHMPIEPAPNYREKYPDTEEGKFHALIDQLDSNIGRVLTALTKSGEADNTLVIVLSDNGGTNNETNNNYPFVGRKATFTEGALRTPLFIRWPGHIEPSVVSDELVSIYDILPTIAQASSATPPADFVGRDLLDPERADPPELYWEYSNPARYNYSVLSSDGRWRLNDYNGWQGLIDLDADPSGAIDVMNRRPDIAEKMTENYLQWRKRVRKVAVVYESLSGRGGAMLSGDELLRSPGYSGFTFAIGVTPSPDETGIAEVIAEQTGRWRLQTTGTHGLHLEVLGQVIEAPALPAGQCSEIVVSSHFHFSPRNPQNNQSHIDLYVNGERTANLTMKAPELNTSGYSNPTYIGMNPSGEKIFRGELSRPLILNERVVPDVEGESIGNGISSVPATCPATGTDKLTVRN